MTNKSLENAIKQVGQSSAEETEGFSEITPEEADELAGGYSGENNTGCPVYNTGCPRPAA